MISYVNLLALLFFTICNGQATYWTGGAGSTNISDASNWSNGVPTLTSIVYINETGCPNCNIVIDRPLTVAELHLIAATASGATLQIQANGSLTVTTALTVGSANPTNYYSTSIEISGGGRFVIGTGCVASVYYTGDNFITSTDQADNWFINNGTITVYGNGGPSAGSYQNVYVGDSSYILNIANYGSWIVTDGQARLYFNNVDNFHIYGGSFKGVFTSGSSSYISIYFDTVDVVLQNGSGRDANGAGGVTFEGVVSFYSSNTQGTNGYATVPPASLIFNTTGVTVSNALFIGVNILFLYDGWLMDCNITSQSLVNSTVASGVHAYINGTNNYVDDSTFAGINTSFIVQVEVGTTITMTSDFSLLGSVTLINNGIWIYNSGSTLYWDVAAYWINLGLLQVINYSNDWIQGSSFYGSTATEVGTLVNMGTIQFSSGGGLNFHQNSGTFLQCTNAILKYVYGSGSAGQSQFANVLLDGKIGFSYSAGVTPSDITIFTFVPSTDPVLTPVFSGSLSFSTSGEPLSYSPLVCYDSTGYVKVYDKLAENGQCPGSTETQILTPVVGGACGGLPDNIKALAASASCPASVSCGADTGSGGGGNPTTTPTNNNPNTTPTPMDTPTDGNTTSPTGSGGSGGSSAASLNASLAFLVSLVCLLLKF